MKQTTLILDKNRYILAFFKQMQENSSMQVRELAAIAPKSTYYKILLPKISKLNMCAERLNTWLFKLEMQHEEGKAAIIIKRNPNLQLIDDHDFIILRMQDEQD